MSQNPPEIPDQGAPRRRVSADESTSMMRDSNGPRSRSADPRAPHTADDALLVWDELDEQLLRMLEEDPDRGWRLRKLQDADGWLRQCASEAARRAAGPALLVCPPPEDLYDFGQGPGANALPAERREAIDRHLATCLECERFVRTLASPPPVPLLLDPPAEPAQDAPAVRPLTRRRTGPRLAPILAAAAAVAGLYLGARLFVASEPRFPSHAVLRGAAGGPAYFPRDRVLLPSPELAARFPALAAPVTFEVEGQAEAESYRFELFRHEGGALGQDVRIDAQVASTNLATARRAKEAGRFTFEAWVVRHGLDQRLGERGFQVAADPLVEARLLALAGRADEERTLAAVHVLHEAGYVTDARALARTLPHSSARDRYLSQMPGR